MISGPCIGPHDKALSTRTSSVPRTSDSGSVIGSPQYLAPNTTGRTEGALAGSDIGGYLIDQLADRLRPIDAQCGPGHLERVQLRFEQRRGHEVSMALLQALAQNVERHVEVHESHPVLVAFDELLPVVMLQR